jgi:ankyrin repeat protein
LTSNVVPQNVSSLLITKGVDVNAVAHSGGTALMFAAAGGYNEVADLLIGKGAEVNTRVKATGG